MEKIKLLLYCTKSKPYLMNLNTKYFISSDRESLCYIDKQDMKSIALNGKIVAECDYEVEKITAKNIAKYEKESCVDSVSMFKYLKPNVIWGSSFEIMLSSFGDLTLGYAIHIKNLHIFDEPRELSKYHRPYGCINISCESKAKGKYLGCSMVRHCKLTQIKQAPQNIMKVESKIDDEKNYILISIRPEWLVKILNKEKTIEIRKKVLKGMI